MKIRGKYVFVLIVYLLFVITTTTFYVFENKITEKETVLFVNASSAIPEGKSLIPMTAKPGENDITEIVLNYNVSLLNSYLNSNNLKVTCKNIKIGTSNKHSNLVNVDINKDYNDDKTEIDIVVTITLNEPDDIEVYQEIMNQIITFDLVFSSYNYYVN